MAKNKNGTKAATAAHDDNKASEHAWLDDLPPSGRRQLDEGDIKRIAEKLEAEVHSMGEGTPLTEEQSKRMAMVPTANETTNVGAMTDAELKGLQKLISIERKLRREKLDHLRPTVGSTYRINKPKSGLNGKLCRVIGNGSSWSAVEVEGKRDVQRVRFTEVETA